MFSALSSASSSTPDKALGARCTLGVLLLEDDGANFESGLLSLRSRSDAVVSLEETRLVVDPATLRATLRIEAAEDISLPDPGGPRCAIVLLRTLARREGVMLMLSRSVRSSTRLRVGRRPVRVSGPRSVAGVVNDESRSSTGTEISVNQRAPHEYQSYEGRTNSRTVADLFDRPALHGIKSALLANLNPASSHPSEQVHPRLLDLHSDVRGIGEECFILFCGMRPQEDARDQCLEIKLERLLAISSGAPYLVQHASI